MMNLQRLRVPLGFAFALLYLLLARPVLGWWLIGIATVSIGLGIRVWAAGHLRKWQQLAISGPYRFTRNPLYLGSSLIGSGFSIASNESFLLVLFLIPMHFGLKSFLFIKIDFTAIKQLVTWLVEFQRSF